MMVHPIGANLGVVLLDELTVLTKTRRRMATTGVPVISVSRL
ncbi:hypothetical protein [Kluyvera georgiana]